MPRATLTFTLPDERAEFDLACGGADWSCLVTTLDRQLRQWIKYGNEFKTADEALGAVRALLHSEASDLNLEL